MIPIETYLIVLPLLILISIVLIKLSNNFGVPALLLFLLIGMLAGSDGFGGIYFDNAYLAQFIGILALIFILFSGGLETNWKFVKPVVFPSFTLATLGVFITAVSVGAFTYYVFNFPFIFSLLLGAIISSTDAAAVFSVLRTKDINLKGNLKPLLELESGSNDPMAIFLTVAFLEKILQPEMSIWAFIPMFLLQMGVGTIMGFLFGYLFLKIINKMNFAFQGIYPVFLLSFIILLYGSSSALGGSGFIAVYIAGIYIGNNDYIYKKGLNRFVDGLAWLSQIVMFLTLGLLVFPKQIIPVALEGVVISAFLILIARPIGVMLSLIPFKYSFKEIVFISWVGLRGAVPIILGTFVLIENIEGSALLFNIVFFIVITSALFQGSSIPFAAKFFGVNSTEEPKSQISLEFDAPLKSTKDLIDIRISPKSQAIDKPIVSLNLPEGNLIVLINRNDDYTIPSGSTTIMADDLLLLIVNKTDIDTIKNTFA